MTRTCDASADEQIARIVSLCDEFRDDSTFVHLRTPWSLHGALLRVAEITSMLPAGSRVLDLGCGAGLMSYLLAQRGYRVSAVDRALPPGTLAAKAGVAPVVVPANDPLPFEDGAFDAVLMVGVLEHVASREDRLAQVRRVLRPGGLLFVYNYPNGWSWVERLFDLIYRPSLDLEPDGSVRGHQRKMRQRPLVALVRGAGYEVIEARTEDVLPRTLRALPARVRRLTVERWRTMWLVERILLAIPGLRLFGSNVQVIARRPVEGASGA